MTHRLAVGRFDGVLKIVRFNPRFYVGSVLGLVTAIGLLLLVKLPFWVQAGTFAGTLLLVFWTLSSLLVSWYVYDVAGVTRWQWLGPVLNGTPARWANIHAGLDESTAALRGLLPGTFGTVVDIYDPVTMTEPSIARARRLCAVAEPAQPGSARALPLPDKDRDAIFLLFAAHELRDPADRRRLLSEARRTLTDGGRVILVEHLRDLPNFIAFGPGFLHFHSGSSWLRSISDAGLYVTDQCDVTPFVRCFTLEKRSL